MKLALLSNLSVKLITVTRVALADKKNKITGSHTVFLLWRIFCSVDENLKWCVNVDFHLWQEVTYAATFLCDTWHTTEIKKKWEVQQTCLPGSRVKPLEQGFVIRKEIMCLLNSTVITWTDSLLWNRGGTVQCFKYEFGQEEVNQHHLDLS